jgi:hypothetical protein
VTDEAPKGKVIDKKHIDGGGGGANGILRTADQTPNLRRAFFCIQVHSTEKRLLEFQKSNQDFST